jgi:hypothetical protein
MNLVKFCENRFQELTLKEQTAKTYDCHSDAESKAVQAILTYYREALRLAYIPKALFHFASVNLKLKPEPKPVILDKMKKDKEKAEKAKKEADGKRATDSTLSVVPKA